MDRLKTNQRRNSDLCVTDQGLVNHQFYSRLILFEIILIPIATAENNIYIYGKNLQAIKLLALEGNSTNTINQHQAVSQEINQQDA